MPFSGKQADTNLFFQHGYLLRDRRLCDVEPVGGAMEIQLLGYSNEIGGDGGAQCFRAEYHRSA
jgi:hypothetical protein